MMIFLIIALIAISITAILGIRKAHRELLNEIIIKQQDLMTEVELKKAKIIEMQAKVDKIKEEKESMAEILGKQIEVYEETLLSNKKDIANYKRKITNLEKKINK